MILNTKHVIVTLTLILSFRLTVCSEDMDCNRETIQCKDTSAKDGKTCSTCLQIHPCCNWCKEQNFNGTRCGTLSDLEGQNCPIDNIIIGGYSRVSNLQDFELNDTDGNRDAVQIKPQKIKIRLREGDNVTFSFKYRAAKNYPIQLYYLMDLTNSMKAHRESLVKIGKNLGNLLKSLTDHYQVAFGYYADKVAMPFYKMTPADVNNPCKMLYGETCSPGFAFVHALDFTNNTDTFVQKVKASNFTSNLDDLENGLEPIIQILQCDKQVLWQRTSRKMIVMATNSLLHMAGDGILAGVTRRHPGGCILNSEGVLEDYLAYDYPSLEEVRRALEIKKVQLVLTGAIENGNDNNNPVHESYYKSLHTLIKDVSVFVNDREIIDSIKRGYEEVTKKIFFRHQNSDLNYLDITYTSTCNTSTDTSAYCEDTNAGREYTFTTIIHLTNLPKGVKEDIVLISEANIEESLEVHIEYIVYKECDCLDNLDGNNCNGHGTFICGQCECELTWYDTNCTRQCTIEECRFTNNTYTSTTCNSKGDCDYDYCKCVCDDDASGEFCEGKGCAKDSRGLICSGNGVCNDGTCDCNDGYITKICDCSTSQTNCYKNVKNTDNDKLLLCEGHGDCVCNKCICKSKEETIKDNETQENKTHILTYSGDYCQYCQNCIHTCSKYKSCIEAIINNKVKDAYCDPSFPEQKEVNDREYGEDACIGEYYNTHNHLCKYIFKLEDNIIMYKNNGCLVVETAQVFILVPLAIILLGGVLALIIWKAYAWHKDRMEFAKFEKDRAASAFQLQSPLYKDPFTRVKNPLYLEKSNNSFD